MRRLIVFASLLVSASLLNAQHGGGGHAGGGGGHASFGGGFSRATVSSQGFSHAAPRFTAPSHNSFPQNSRYQQGSANRTGNGSSGHPGRTFPRNGRHGGGLGYRGYGYGYGFPLIGYSAFGYDDGFDDSAGDQNYQGNAVANDTSLDYGYQEGPAQGPEEAYNGPVDPGNGLAGTRPPYNPGGNLATAQGQPNSQGSGSNGLQHPKVTLVFKDGRRLQAQNYAITQTKVLLMDNSAERDIPISVLDVNATAAANEAAGVDFSLPGAQ